MKHLLTRSACFALLLLTCSNFLQSQSLYQDAKTLARLLRASNDQNTSEDYWFKLAQALPVVYAKENIQVNSEWPVASLYERDYLVMNLGDTPDSLVIYQRENDTLLQEAVIGLKYDFCILQVRKNGYFSEHEVRVLLPYGGSEVYYGDGWFGPNSFIDARDTTKRNFLVMEGRPGSFEMRNFVNNRFSCTEKGLYFIPDIPSQDVVEMYLGNQEQLYFAQYGRSDSMSVVVRTDSIYHYPADFRYKVPKDSTIMVKKSPIVLYNNVDFGFFSDGQMRILGFSDYAAGIFLADHWQSTDPLELRIVVNRDEQVLNQNNLKLHADSIPINNLVSDVYLSRYDACGDYNQLLLYKGRELLKAVPLKTARQLKNIRFNAQSNQIEYELEQDIDLNNEGYFSYRKQSTAITQPDSFSLVDLVRSTRRMDYSCNYLNFVDAYNGRPNEGLTYDQTDSLLLFNMLEIGQEQDSTFSAISLAELRKKVLYAGRRYAVSLNHETVTPENGIWDGSDLYFELYHANLETEEAAQQVFNWYPGDGSELVIFWKDDQLNFYCTPATEIETYTEPISGKDTMCVLLGVHSQLRSTDLESENLWGEISEKYRNNPYLGSVLRKHLASNAVEQLPGISNEVIANRIGNRLESFYAWQKYIFDGVQLDTAEQVSYAELSETYRTPIPTASEDLQVASEKFESESRKLKRGLNTADLAAGLSDFIVERAQEELNINFLNRLKSNILSDSSEFNVLFPKSTRVMEDFDIRQYRTLLLYARGAFEQDLRSLGVRFPKLFNLPKYQALQNDPNVYNIFLLYDIANKVYEDMPIDTVLLHVHSRLRERKYNLEEAIYRSVSDSLCVDMAKRTELSAILDSFIVAFEAYHYAEAYLREAYANGVWQRVFTEVESKTRLKEAFVAQFPEPALEYGADFIGNQPAFLAPLYFARNNINGDPDYNYLINSMNFNQFDEYFSVKPDSAFTISLGLENARKLLAPELLNSFKQRSKEMAARINAVQRFYSKLELYNASTINTLDTYLPIFEKLKTLQVKRMMLFLAIDSELRRIKPTEQHAVAALTYLKTVLESPQTAGMHDWAPLDLMLGELPISLDSLKKTGYGFILPFSTPDSLSMMPYENLELVAALSQQVDNFNLEIEKGTAFVDQISQTARRQFSRMAEARDTAISAAVLDTLYRYFLYSDILTNQSLAPNPYTHQMVMQDVADALFSGTTPARPMIEGGLSPESVEMYDLLNAPRGMGKGDCGNPFLDFYDKYTPFTPQEEYTNWALPALNQEFELVHQSFAKLDTISRAYHRKLAELQDNYAPRLMPSLKQAEQFDTLIQVTLLWMQAFKTGTDAEGTVTVNDTTTLHMIRALGANTQAQFDSVVVKQRKIAAGSGVRQWMTQQQFNEVMEDTLTRKAFLGLLHQRLSAIGESMQYSTPNMTLLAAKFMNNLYEIDDARELLRYKKRNNQPLGFEDYFPFIRTTVNMLNIVFETPVRSGTKTFKERFPALANVPEISNESLSLFENVFAQNYSDAIRNVAHLLSITWGLDADSKKQKLALFGGDWSIKEKRKFERQVQLNQKVKSSILLYGSFMANMAEARTPDQVKAAIRSVAVPPGNSSVKRNTYMNLDLNGYFGATYFRETLNSEEVPEEFSQKGGVGLSVPVGITFSMGQLGRKKRHSFSLFFPVIDLGAVTAFRLQEENIQSELPELSFRNLITPGAYLLYNVPKSPFTIGIGGQVGPQLRKVTVNGAELSTSAYRFGITASIDVPIFNFYSRQERK